MLASGPYSRRLVGRLFWLFGLAPLALGGCGGDADRNLAGTESRAVECAPYARELTGIELDGTAYQWWDQAAGRYRRSALPSVGAALVFRRSSRLPEGHVAVVDRIVTAREIMVNQANWIHHRISHDDEVWDVSDDNDWTLVRVWWKPAGNMGIISYPTYGFVGPGAASIAELGAAGNRSLQPRGSSAICALSLIDLATPLAG